MFALANARTKRVALVMLGGALLLTTHRAVASDQPPVACARLEAAEIRPGDLAALFALGDCQQRAGRSASAWHTFLEAEAVARAQNDRARAERAAERVAALAPQLTQLVFVVPKSSRLPGLTLRLGENTVPPSSWDRSIPVDGGVLHVSATAKGYRPWSMEIDASHSAGQSFRVNVPMLTSLRPERPRAARGKAYRTAGVVTGSFGLAGLGAGAVFGALSHNSESPGTCVKGQTQCTSGKSNGANYSDAAAVSFALGGALLATGVTLFVLAPSADNQEKNALRLAARYAGSGGRLQLEGVW